MIIEPQPNPELSTKQRSSFTELRQVFQNIGIKVFKRILQSYNFVTGSTGWRLQSSGDLEASNGTFRGALIANSINIPNSTTPKFSVDILGNTKVSSLERNDFHWFTLFESIDGYAKSTAGTGTIIANSTFVGIISGVIAGNISELQKFVQNVGLFTWAKNRKLRFQVQFQTNTAQTISIVMGDGSSSVTRQLGFFISDNAINAKMGNGATSTIIPLSQTFFAGAVFTLEVKWVSGVRAEWYIDGELRLTRTTFLPSGAIDAGKLLNILVQTDAAVAKEINLNYWDFWQAN